MTTTIVNVRVFDGERVADANAVRFDGDRIVAVGDQSVISAEDNIVDGDGCTLTPGLIDAHIHLLPGAAEQALDFGITTMLDMFSKPEQLQEHLNRSPSDTSAATIYSAGVGATAPGGHPSMMYAPFPYVQGPSDASAFIRTRIAEGSSFLKVFYEGGQSIEWAMPSLSAETLTELVTVAHEYGLKVVAHATDPADAVTAACLGVDILAHSPFDRLSDEQIEQIAAQGTAIISTLSIVDGFPQPGAPMPLLTHADLAERLGDKWTEVIAGQGQRWIPPGMPSFENAFSNIRSLHEAGCQILAGTDSPNPGTVHGASLHRELLHLVHAGLSPIEALQSATNIPAQIFNLETIGRIAPGHIADLLLIDGNPDADIEKISAIRGVWKAGAFHNPNYVGTPLEEAGLQFLNAQTQRVIAAVFDQLPALSKDHL